MRAFTFESFDAEPALRDDLPEPDTADNGLLVRVRASSVNGADVAIAAGMLKDMVEHEFPVTLGRDFAGIVERVGDGRSSTTPPSTWSPRRSQPRPGGIRRSSVRTTPTRSAA